MSADIKWDDGTWAVIEAKDLPPGCPRSKTNKTLKDAVASNSWDPALTTPPGPKSAHDLVKVKLQDLKDFEAKFATLPMGRQARPRPADYGGTSTKRVIPDYPHKCLVCGGRTLVLFSSTEHEGGQCPGPPNQKKARW